MANRNFHILSRHTTAAIIITLGVFTVPGVNKVAVAQHYEYEKLLANDGGAYDDFGYAVAVQGDFLIAGAYGDDATGGTDSGSAYIYHRDGPNWVFMQKIEPSDPAPFDYFGYAVELHDDMAMVGSISDEPGGSVYVFRYDPQTNTWNQIQKIIAPDVQQGDSFGSAIAVDGRYMAIGARMDSDVAQDAGSVYVYEYEESISQWQYLDEFHADDAAANEWFGEQLAMNSPYIVVGLPRDDPNGTSSGSAYLFESHFGTYNQIKKFIPDDGIEDAHFGSSVGIDNETIIIGARQDWPGANRTGSAYIYRKFATQWSLEQKIYDNTSTANSWDQFGCSVDIIGDTALIGAWGSDANAPDCGCAYIFTRSGSTWSPFKPYQFAFDAEQFDEFGCSVDLDNTTAVIGAYQKADNGTNTGAAYAFNNILFTLNIDPDPMIAGAPATFQITHGQPNTQAFLAYSLRGLQKTYIAALNISIELRTPKQAGNMTTTDVNGNATWILNIPLAARGKLIWMQALQRESKTNIIPTSAQ